jgi:hypothetical protein
VRNLRAVQVRAAQAACVTDFFSQRPFKEAESVTVSQRNSFTVWVRLIAAPNVADDAHQPSSVGEKVNMLRVAALTLGLALGIVASGMGLWQAQADNDALPVPAHRHFIFEDGVKEYIGPNFCDNDRTSQGFYNFHWNVHRNMKDDLDVLAEGCD